MKVIEEKDYVNNMKNSGYRSYHMIIEYNVETMNGPKCIHAEIQIRTLAMNFWATIEHSLQYKYKKNIPDHIREKLSSAADAIIVSGSGDVPGALARSWMPRMRPDPGKSGGGYFKYDPEPLSAGKQAGDRQDSG